MIESIKGLFAIKQELQILSQKFDEQKKASDSFAESFATLQSELGKLQVLVFV